MDSEFTGVKKIYERLKAEQERELEKIHNDAFKQFIELIGVAVCITFVVFGLSILFGSMILIILTILFEIIINNLTIFAVLSIVIGTVGFYILMREINES